jgi:hypothetical protein
MRPRPSDDPVINTRATLRLPYHHNPSGLQSPVVFSLSACFQFPAESDDTRAHTCEGIRAGLSGAVAAICRATSPRGGLVLLPVAQIDDLLLQGGA